MVVATESLFKVEKVSVYSKFEQGTHFNKHLKPKLFLSAMQTIWNL